MRFNMTVIYQDGNSDKVVAAAPDFVAFERTFDRSVARFETEIKFTDICWLAWHKLNKQGKASDFDTWLETIESVSIDESEDFVPLESPAPTS
jgi:hypothetical protein